MRWQLVLPLLVASLNPPALTDVKVPNLVKLDVEDAKDNVEWLGLVFEVDPIGTGPNRSYDPSQDAGLVVEDQNPDAGQTASPGSVVSVVLIVPPEPKVTYFVAGAYLLILILFLLLRRCCGRTGSSGPA